MKVNQKVTAYINTASSEQQEILMNLRQLIHDNIDNVTEEIKWGIPVFIKKKIFTYLRVTKKHIAIGLYNIDRIKDEDGILEGKGKTMRHLKIKAKEDINQKIIIEWLKLTAE
ncbi:MAG: DUF1801 domain-containing protein [Gilvibacter sp.]